MTSNPDQEREEIRDGLRSVMDGTGPILHAVMLTLLRRRPELVNEIPALREFYEQWFSFAQRLAALEGRPALDRPVWLDPPSADDIARAEEIDLDAETVALIEKLRGATNNQIDTWVDNNATTLATARNVIKAIIKVLARLV